MKNPKRTGFLAMLALSLVAFFSAGCGNSESFVFTGTQNQQPTPGTGSLQFRFTPAVAAQSAAVYPEGTANLFFSLHTGNPPSAANLDDTAGPVSVDALNDDGTYVLTNVDPVVNTVVILAATADGLPLAAWQATGIKVLVDETVPVDLGAAELIDFTGVIPSPNPLRLIRDGEPVQLNLALTFSNGATIELDDYDSPEVTFTGVDPTVANFTTSGEFSAITGNTGVNDTATVEYNLFGVKKSADFKIEVYELRSVARSSVPDGEVTDLDPEVDFIDSKGQIRWVEDDVVLSLQAPVPSGVSLVGQSLDVESGVEGSVTVLVTYTDPDTGLVLTDTFTVQVSLPK